MPPAKFEAGTGHFAGAVGLGAAIDYLESLGRPNVAAHEQALMHYAIDALSKVPGLRLLGSPKVRIGALPFVMAGYEVTEVARSLDERGIAVRAGHHCAQPILRRFGLEASVRASLGVYSAHDDIDALVAALRALSARRSK
jgi:cysteine desulfurase/selenocysteine lyase